MIALWLRRCWPFVVALTVCVALALGIRAAWRGHYAAGRRDALAEAAAVAPAQRDTVRLTIARTDTVVRVISQQAARVRDIAERVPDTVRVLFPTVDTLVVEAKALADSLPRLIAVVQTERAAHQSLALSLSLVTVAKSDTIRVLRRRPTRKFTALLMLTTGALSYLAGAR